MAYSFKKSQDLVVANSRYPDDSTMRDRAKNWLQEAYEEATSAIVIPSLESTFRFSLLAGAFTQQLPVDVASIINVRILDRNGDDAYARNLDEWSADEFDHERPHLARTATADQGIPAKYRVQRINGILNDAAAVDEYFVESDDQGDNLMASLVAYLDSGRTRINNFSVALGGMTKKSLGNAYQAIAVSKDGNSKGTITFTKRVKLTTTTPVVAPAAAPTPQPTSATIGFRQQATTTSAGALVTDLTVTMPVGIQSGDLLLLQFSVIDESTNAAWRVFSGFPISSGNPWTAILGPTPSRPWLRQVGSSGNGGEMGGFWVIAGASEPATIRLTFTAPVNVIVGISAWTNVDPATPLNVIRYTPSGYPAITGNSISDLETNVDSEMLILTSLTNAVTSATPDATMTERWDVNSDGPGTSDLSMTQSSKLQAQAGVIAPIFGSDDATGSVSNGISAIVSLVPQVTTLATAPTAPTAATNPVFQVVARIGPTDIEPQNFFLEVDPVLDNTFQFETRFQRKVPMMRFNADTFWFVPGVWHQMIVEGAIAKGEKFILDERVALSKQEFHRLNLLFQKKFKAIRVRHVGFTWDVSDVS